MGGPHHVTTVVFHGRTNVPGIKGVWHPCLLLGWSGMRLNSNSQWGNWGSFEIIAPMELFPCQQFGVDPGLPQQVQREFSLWYCFVPKVHWEVWVHQPPACCQVVFCSADCSFGCITPMFMWWHELVLYFLLLEPFFELLGALIVQSMELWFAAAFG